MSRFVDIDLSRLPTLPLGTETWDTIRAARIAELKVRLQAAGFAWDVDAILTDPLVVTEEAGAWRELLAATRRDDAVRSVLLATSWGVFLDHLGAGQTPPVVRKILVAADAASGTAAVMEGDDEFRRRIQLAPEALTTCGTEGAYLFFALETDGVAAAAVYGPMSFGGSRGEPFAPLGEVHVPIVAAAGDGTAPPALVAAATASLSEHPIADLLTVSAAIVVPYEISVRLTVGPGADRALVAAEAERRLAMLAMRQRRPGAAVLFGQIYASAYVADAAGAPIVEHVAILSPPADVNADPIAPATPAGAYRVPSCTRVTVEVVSDA